MGGGMGSSRGFDLAIALALGILGAPLFLLAALALRLEGRGPILHRSPRLGRDGRPFGLLRFRTMAEGRLTPVGRVLRECSLDDLPNLLNVLRGEMAIVGPRPTEPERVDLADPAWREVLAVRPGLVSHAIVTKARAYNAASPAEKLSLERDYVRRRSPGGDARLLAAALRALVASRGNIKARGRPKG
jgi:lipopolysaccharide/colanic/teichoic acid biosynthesis glycosyltransferase